MVSNTIKIFLLALIMAVTVGGLSGCEQDSQERYEDAVQELKQARKAHAESLKAVREKKQELEQTQDKLAQARERLSEAQARLQQAESRIQKRATDTVLFRAVQKKMLDEEAFPGAAIAVSVSRAQVTLTGTVPSEKMQEKAVRVAADHPGVVSVDNQLQVETESEADAAQTQ